jgi:hypothetical protein
MSSSLRSSSRSVFRLRLFENDAVLDLGRFQRDLFLAQADDVAVGRHFQRGLGAAQRFFFQEQFFLARFNVFQHHFGFEARDRISRLDKRAVLDQPDDVAAKARHHRCFVQRFDGADLVKFHRQRLALDGDGRCAVRVFAVAARENVSHNRSDQRQRGESAPFNKSVAVLAFQRGRARRILNGGGVHGAFFRGLRADCTLGGQFVFAQRFHSVNSCPPSTRARFP